MYVELEKPRFNNIPRLKTYYEAYHRLGFTDDTRIGYAKGIISLLTKERLDRKEYTKEAIRMALIHLENSDLY